MAYTNYEFFYEGIYKPVEQDYGDLFTGYRFPGYSIGASTSTQTANQVQEVSSRLNEGMKVVEMSVLDPRVMGMIPKQHMKELNQLSKLTGSETTLHGPLIDPAGFSREGWSEFARHEAEQEMLQIVERAHELNPKGNVPVSFHSSNWGFPGAEYEKTKTGEKETVIVAVNPETGQPSAFKEEKVYYPGEETPREYGPRKRLEVYNETAWSNQITGLLQMAKHGDEILRSPYVEDASKVYLEAVKGHPVAPEDRDKIAITEDAANKALMFFQDVEAGIRSMYDNAYKYGIKDAPEDEKQRGIAAERAKILTALSKQYTAMYKEMDERKRRGEHIDILDYALKYKRRCDEGIAALKHITPVQMMRPVEEFALDKSARTIANVAFQSYKKFGTSAPIVSLENPPGEIGGFSRAKQLKQLINASREQFVQNAVNSGMSETRARGAAEKLIGATWDVGHINLMRKGGFTEEDIIKETKAIAPFVKHVHLADNFGFQEAHLPPGMGGVPIKPMLEELEKAGFKGKAIVEAGEFVQHFKASPHPYALSALGSPLYDIKMAPYWNQIQSSYGSYFGGYGTMLPEEHFSMYGAGFSTLPTELGGRVPGKQSRLTGTPME